MFRNRINKPAERNTAVKKNLLQPFLALLSQTCCYWDKQQFTDSNIILFHLTLKSMKNKYF